MQTFLLQPSLSRRLRLALIALLAFGITLSFIPSAHADDDPKRAAMQAAHDLLMKAHDESDVQQRIVDLKAARGAIAHSSPGAPGPHRQGAIDQVNAAIHALKMGDPNDEANRYIENANRRIGY